MDSTPTNKKMYSECPFPHCQKDCVDCHFKTLVKGILRCSFEVNVELMAKERRMRNRYFKLRFLNGK